MNFPSYLPPHFFILPFFGTALEITLSPSNQLFLSFTVNVALYFSYNEKGMHQQEANSKIDAT